MESEYDEKGQPKGLSFNFFPEQQQCVVCESYKPPAAIVIRNATKNYGKRHPVIKGLNMTVRQGTIYSLLGCSGCGKSTSLACIVGIDKFTSGDIWLFGRKPGAKEVGIPGRNVGYMPQDYSLYNEFTIMEIFMFFGLLNGMHQYEIMCSLVFYTELLNLPNCSSRIGSLSGGQKRRVSFAISIQHQPELVLLDEPTVGVDALLRESIWKYLVNLTRRKNLTVIITTHYIEEARRSNTVGIMNNGKLIAEESPTVLLDRFQTNSLEHVVLQLTRNENALARYQERATSLPAGSDSSSDLQSVVETLQIASALPQMALIKSEASTADSLTRIRGLVNKNVRVAVRSITMLVMIIIIPILGITCNFIANGNNLTDLRFGVVNEELTNSSSCYDLRESWEGACEAMYFSCRYLKHLSNMSTFTLKKYKSGKEAEEAVEKGEIWGYLHFPKDYSWFFYERAASGINLTDFEVLEQSKVTVRMDESSTIIKLLIAPDLAIGFREFLVDLLKGCNYDPKRLDIGLVYQKPILGEDVKSFTDYLMPSAYIGFLFFWPIVTSGIRFVNEKRDGTIERTLVAGVNIWEIFIAYSVTEFFIACSRMLLMYIFAVYVFKMFIGGSIILQFLLGLMSSYMGVFAGFLIGALCTEEIQVALLALCIFLPNMLLSGMCWPLEGMPPILQNIAYILPCTLSCESMRSITSRGWEFTHENVWPGFASSLGYMILYFVLAMAAANFRFAK